MKNRFFAFMALFWITGLAGAQIQAGLSVGTDGNSFHLAIGDYYHAPPAQVEIVQQRHIPDEDQPVVFFMAQQCHVAPGVIIDLRAHGMPWVGILNRYHVNPRIFYVPIHGSVRGTPYERFYAYYHGGRRIHLMDADIVNMVNLRFASDYYHRTPEEIIRLRSGGKSYSYIHDQYRPHGMGRDMNDRDNRHNDDRDHRRHDDRSRDRRDDGDNH